MGKLRLGALLICGAFIGCSDRSEPGVEPSDAGVDAPVSGALSGKVVLVGTTELAGFPLTLIGPVAATAITDAGGAFSFELLPAGRYAVSVTVPSTLEGSRGTVVDVAEGAAVVPDFAFTPLGELTGKVTLGSPTGNAGITVVVAGTASSGITDDSGTYALRGVPAGARDVVASLPGWSSGTASAVRIEYRKLATAPDIVLARPAVETGSLEGTIAITGETVHAGVTIVAVGATGTSAAITDASGAWSMKGLPAGKYSLSVTAPSTLEGTRNAEATVDVGKTATVDALSFTPLGTLRGKVTLGGRATGNGGISVWVPDAAVVFTDDAGNWEIRSARTGVSTIRASKEGWTLRSVESPKLAWRGDATASSMDLAMDPSSTSKFSGIAKVVGRTTHDGVEVALSGSSWTTTTAADGSYAMEVLETGLRTLSFKTKDGLFEARIPNVLLTAGGTAFVVSGSSLLPIPSVKLVRGRWIGQGRPLGMTPSGEVVTCVSAPIPRIDLISTTTGAAKTLVSGVATSTKLPVISSDGAQVAFLSGDSIPSWYVVPTAGGAPDKLVNADVSVPPEFSPDGKALVYLTDGSSKGLMIRTLATGKVVRAADTTAHYYSYWRWLISPDGAFVACPSSEGTTLAPVAGGTPIQVKDIYGARGWTSDGRFIRSTTCVSTFPRTCDLSVATPGSSGAERVLFADSVTSWELSPDSKWLLTWQQSSTTKSVWLASLATSDVPVLLAEDTRGSAAINPPAAFSADSSQVAFALPASSPNVVKLLKLTSPFTPTVLGSFSDAGRLSFIGSTVAVRGQSDDAEVWFVPSGATPTKVAAKAFGWKPSPESSKVVWQQEFSGGLRFASASGIVSSVGPGSEASISWAPDSGRLAARFSGTEWWTGVIDTTGTSGAIPVTWQIGVQWLSPSQALLTDWWPDSYGKFVVPTDESLFVAKFP